MKFVLVLTLLIVWNFTKVYTQEKTFIREYTYKASELDSKISSRAIVINELRLALLNEIGIYVESESFLKTTEFNSKYSQDFIEKITTMTAGVTKLSILEEKWNGIEFWMKAAITIDKTELELSLRQLIQDRQKVKELEDTKQKLDNTTKELNRLKSELNNIKVNNPELMLESNRKYNNQINKLTASEYFLEGQERLSMDDYYGAIQSFNKAIDYDPEDPVVYAKRGSMKLKLNDVRGAIDDFDKSIKLDPRFDLAFAARANAKYRLKEYKKAIFDYDKAIDISPYDSDYYFGRGLSRLQLGQKDRGCSDLGKAGELGNELAYKAIKDFCN